MTMAMGADVEGAKSRANEFRTMVFHARYRAHVNVQYFVLLAPYYAVVERVVAWFIALGASASIMKLTIWTTMPGSAEWFAGVTAAFSVASVVFNLSQRVTTIVEIQSKWMESRIVWDLLWADIEAGKKVSPSKIRAARKPEVELQKLEATLCKWGRLVAQAQDKACVAMGIPKQGDHS